MPNFGQYESEVAFISGVSDTNTAAAISYYTMAFNEEGNVIVPVRYETQSTALKWGSTTPGTAGGNITYWFDEAADWSGAEETVWTGAFGLWSALADISFSIAPDAGSANITLKRLSNGQAFANTGSTASVAVDSPTISAIPTTGAFITIDTSSGTYGPIDANPNTKGGYPWSTVIHEIGHILGLGHAGPYNGAVNGEQQQFGVYDSEVWSLMSYVYPSQTRTRYFPDYPVAGTYWGSLAVDDQDYRYEPLTPQMLDILAIQRLYGAQTGGPFTGGQVYGFSSNITDPFLASIYNFTNNPSAILTLWNSGTNNTLDLSGFSQDATVNLTPGTFSSAGGKTNNIAIAFDTSIETAIGGGGNDSIVANSALISNLQGGNGNDTLTGGAQADTLAGDNGNDILVGQGGADTMFGGDGNDLLLGGAGGDTMTGGIGNDVLVGGAGGDTMTGGTGPDVFQFALGDADGDTVRDFSGSGGDGDVLQFFGYGAGATFVQTGPTTWQVMTAGGATVETITFANSAAIAPGDYAFFEAYTQLANSSYLDFASWRSNDTTLPTGGTPLTGTTTTVNVALVLERANDPTALLSQGWGARTTQLGRMSDSELWSTYGADQAQYNAAKAALAALGISTIDELAPDNGYVSTVQSRTIWVQVTADSFPTLFGPQAVLMQESGGGWYWTGSLSLPTSLSTAGVTGLWFDTNQFGAKVANPGSGTAANLPQGPQSPGNDSSAPAQLYPQTVAASYYNMPLGPGVATGAIGLVEPVIGTALPNDAAGAGFQAALDAYRTAAGVRTGALAISVAPGGQIYGSVRPNNSGERSLDVGMVATAAPNSPMILYAGSGSAGGAAATAFTAYQSAIWDTVNNPAVVSSSFHYASQMTTPGSPFHAAASGLFVDAALRGITVFNSNNDGGSGDQIGNGLTNISTTRSSPFVVTVGGTSFSTTAAALMDGTLETDVGKASAGDLGTIWKLVAGGMTQSPVGMLAGTSGFMETVWNQYVLSGTAFSNASGTGYLTNNAGSGGADPSQGTPWYQTAYGLVPFTQDPYHLVGRGTPDVAINAGGNLSYTVPTGDMVGVQSNIGTSAATPLWAALGVQLNAIFRDQGLPKLGYMTDLLYIASAIAPASFNDVVTGNNTSSYVNGGDYTSDGSAITPTGYGSTAGPGYDLASGLGTPNGTLLARALTQIGHHQISYDDSAALMNGNATDGWTSGTDQTLLVQAATVAKMDVSLTIGADRVDLEGNTIADEFAWTARFAQQSLQADFDANLVRMFDMQAQGWVGSRQADSGDALSAVIGQGQGFARQADLTSPYGFADFSTAPYKPADDKPYDTGGTVHLARAVAIAETPDGTVGQNAVVRVRQNGTDDLAVSFYKVDDLAGAIGTVKPGDAGYAAAVAGRVYGLDGGGSALEGPGYGLFAQAQITNVNAHDLVAMTLINHSTGETFFAFAPANGDKGTHLYNYGINVWGFEDRSGSSSDHDFNDMVVQLDFTSPFGSGWLV